MSGLPTQTHALPTRSESRVPPLSVAVNLTNHFAPTRATDSSADAESYTPRNAHSVLTVNHAVTHYTVAVGPTGPGRHRIVAAIEETKNDTVFRRVTDNEDVVRIAAGAGVSREEIGGGTCFMGAIVPDRTPESEPDRAPEVVPDRAPEIEPDRAPEPVPDRAPEPVPDRAPEPVPDRA